MSTKAYLSAIVLAITGTAFAADVVSANIVGYTTVTAPKGAFAIIANQLDNGKGNKVADLIPKALIGTTLYKFAANNFVLNSNDGDAWDAPNATLNPGEGAFVFSPSAEQKFVFAGDVKGINGESSFAPKLTKKAFNLVASVVPVETQVKDLGLPATIGDTVYTFLNNGFILNTHDGVAFDVPTDKVAVGQGFFVFVAGDADKTWNRVFNVN